MLIERVEKIVRARFEAPAKKVDGAVLLASFPKSGNTWFRFVVGNVLSQLTSQELVDFHSISKYSPEIRGGRHLSDAVFTEGCPTFLKTHFYKTRCFASYPAVVLFRDPVKSLFSYYQYMAGEHGRTYRNFAHFIRSPRVGVDSWLLFHRSWLTDSQAVFISYEELVSRPGAIVKNLYEKLGFDINEIVIENALRNSSRDAMRVVEVDRGDPNKKNVSFNFVSIDPQRYGKPTKTDEDYIRLRCDQVYSESLSRMTIL